jgi:excisionase family DNA binding protein
MHQKELHLMEPIESKSKESGQLERTSVRLLTVEQASQYLGRSVHSIREMVYRRTFPVVKAGKKSKMWLDVRDLDAWVSQEKRYL